MPGPPPRRTGWTRGNVAEIAEELSEAGLRRPRKAPPVEWATAEPPPAARKDRAAGEKNGPRCAALCSSLLLGRVHLYRTVIDALALGLRGVPSAPGCGLCGGEVKRLEVPARRAMDVKNELFERMRRREACSAMSGDATPYRASSALT